MVTRGTLEREGDREKERERKHQRNGMLDEALRSTEYGLAEERHPHGKRRTIIQYNTNDHVFIAFSTADSLFLGLSTRSLM